MSSNKLVSVQSTSLKAVITWRTNLASEKFRFGDFILVHSLLIVTTVVQDRGNGQQSWYMLVFCMGPVYYSCPGPTTFTPASAQPTAVFTVWGPVHVIFICSDILLIVEHHGVESGAVSKVRRPIAATCNHSGHSHSRQSC